MLSGVKSSLHTRHLKLFDMRAVRGFLPFAAKDIDTNKTKINVRHGGRSLCTCMLCICICVDVYLGLPQSQSPSVLHF